VADNAAVLYSSHHIAEVESSCDAIAIINHGCLISNLPCLDSEDSTSHFVEVSSKEVATQIAGKDISLLKDGWVSCIVENSGEQIVAMVQGCDGKIRLLQRATQPLELKYLELIRESDGVAISGDSC
jgi:ABC-type multidrug transport system ATPase subunit